MEPQRISILTGALPSTLQLNFYSFRKINRERNVWIYKHKLFHRDRPDDLYQVRRRTCPGVDGRKQRFSRYSAQKLGKYDDANQSSDDEESSLEDTTSGDESEIASGKKRRGSMSSVASNNSKRIRRLWQAVDSEKALKVDTVVTPDPSASPTSVFDAPKAMSKDADVDDESSTNKKSDRMEMMERSLVVSEVASKLEEFVKKALKGRGSARSRRAGVVTPPYGYSRSAVVTSRDLITYDDEYVDEEDKDLSGLVSDGDDSLHSADASISGFDENSKDMDVAPVLSAAKVQDIVNEIRKRATWNHAHGPMIVACAEVAEFLMTTAPGENASVCCRKVLRLLLLSERLSSDFNAYRAALHPDGAGFMKPENLAEAMRQILETGSTRLEALREFKIFAVNLMYSLLGNYGSFGIEHPFGHSEASTLLHTADVWSKSVGRFSN